MLLALLPAVALAASAPGWVSAFPHDPDAYVGVGYADKRRHPVRYREAAQAAALAQISREISVSLRSEEALSRREDGLHWEESWSQSLRAESRNDLAGYRLVDVYETVTGFWACYSLDKAEHARRMEARWSADAEALETLLAARNLPEAWRRLAALDTTEGPASEGRARLDALERRIRSQVANSILVPESGRWTWDPGTASSRAEARMRLREGVAGGDWQGTMRLRIRPQGDTAGGCAVETDGKGGFDIAPLFLACGLEPGAWRVTWMEPGPGGPAATVEAGILAREWALAVRAGPPGMIPWQGPVAAELEALASPYFRIRGEGEAGDRDRIEIRLLASEADSLEGLHFIALRGTLRLPGGGAHAVNGKGGHSDRAKARERALRDFAAEVGKRLAPAGKAASGKKAGALSG